VNQHQELSQLLERYLKISEQLRPGYLSSLGAPADPRIVRQVFAQVGASSLHELIYSRVSGTPHQIQEQWLMDFTPGFRLIHIHELTECVSVVRGRGPYLPLLANYSSDYVAVNLVDECVYSVDHDSVDTVLLHKSSREFITTICACYDQDAYFLDADGYLDYDADAEAEIGSKLNPDVAYWNAS